jgi:hypothetical protein
MRAAEPGIRLDASWVNCYSDSWHIRKAGYVLWQLLSLIHSLRILIQAFHDTIVQIQHTKREEPILEAKLAE